MFTPTRTDARGTGSLRLAVSVAATLALLSISTAAYCQDLQNLAPPVQSAPVDAGAGNQNEVFNWTEVPLHADVPITRATFDKSGYQLYDTKGETVLVPFQNDNLKVMKFGVSDNGSMYFRKDNSGPVLYVPEGGYLENASVPGARWYPFTSKFHPETAVYEDIAPNYSDYCDMYWEPNTYIYGGYWCNAEFGIYTPCFGFFFDIGGYPYYGWGGYLGWSYWHPYGFQVGLFDHGFYGRGFGGGYGRGFGGGFGGGRGFRGASGFGGGRGFRGASGGFGGHGSFGGSGRTFRGASGGFGGHGSFGGGGRTFRGASGGFGGGHSFGGGGGGGHFGGSGGGGHFGGGGGGGHFGGGGGGGGGGHFGGGGGGGHFGGGGGHR